MAGPVETKNFGIIKAIFEGTTAPLQIKALWYDDNVGEKRLKYYNIDTNAWVPLNFGITGDLHEASTFTTQSHIEYTYTMAKTPSVTILELSTGDILEAQVNINTTTKVITLDFNAPQTGVLLLN